MSLPLSYHWRHLFYRKAGTLVTILVVAVVVGVFTWMVSFADAMNKSLSMASDSRKIIVLRRGATAESSSAIPKDEFAKLNQLSDIARDPATNEPLLSPEMLVQVCLPRLRDGGKTIANVAVRGVTPVAFKVHRNVKPLGTMFDTGALEVIVGKKAAEQFAGLKIGDYLPLGFGGNRGYKVVGYFSADGGPMESEIWGYRPSLESAYGREVYSSGSLLLREGADASTVLKEIDGPAIQLSAVTESAYWQEQSKLIRTYLMIAKVLIGMMSAAAICAIANTMFSMVAGRTREIAMLRTIGFSNGSVITGFVVEAVMLALLGGIVGCAAIAVWGNLVGHSKDMYGQSTFTTLAFDIKITPFAIGIALLSVALVGMLGAIYPASRAVRLGLVDSLREP